VGIAGLGCWWFCRSTGVGVDGALGNETQITTLITAAVTMQGAVIGISSGRCGEREEGRGDCLWSSGSAGRSCTAASEPPPVSPVQVHN